MGDLNFNSDEHKPKDRDFTPVPEGEYKAWITEARVVSTKAGDGKMLKVTLELLEPVEFARKKVFDMFNIQNPSAQAVEIGLGQLSALCKALGKSGIVEDSSELLNIEVVVKLKIDDSYDPSKPQNKVVKYSPTKATQRALDKLAAITSGVVAPGEAAPVDDFPDDDDVNF